MTDFDIEGLRSRYLQERPNYEILAEHLRSKIESLAQQQGVKAQVSCRTKDVASYLKKALKKQYQDPHNQIRDKAGARLVAQFLPDVEKLEHLVCSTFQVLKSEDKRSLLLPQHFDYRATHYQIKDAGAPQEIRDLECEVQILTRAESLWADTVHDLFYKPATPLPPQIERTFYRLVSLVELFDREVERAMREMSTIEGFQQSQLLRTLENLYYPLSGKEYDSELSGVVLTMLEEAIARESILDIQPEVESFVNRNRTKLIGLYDRYREDDRCNPLIWQPETLLIFLQLETDSFRLKETWENNLPIRLLEGLAEIWGHPI